MIALSTEQLDALTELVNIGVGRAANTLNELTDKHISLSIPSIVLADIEGVQEFGQNFGEQPVAAVLQEFSGGYAGRAGLIIPEDSAYKLVAALTGETPVSDNLDVLQGETLVEIGNIVINAMIGSMSNILGGIRLSFGLAEYYKDQANRALHSLYAAESLILIARIHFNIRELEVSGHILLTFDVGTAPVLLGLLNKAME